MAPFPESLFAESTHPGHQLPLPAGARGPSRPERFQELKRLTVDEEIGRMDAGGALRRKQRVGPVLYGAIRTPPMTRHIVRWSAWAQLAVGLLLLWSAVGDAPIPAVLKFP